MTNRIEELFVTASGRYIRERMAMAHKAIAGYEQRIQIEKDILLAGIAELERRGGDK